MLFRSVYDPACELVHLSAPSGGVRVEDALRGEMWRFRNTAYFVLKHRGWSGFPPFLATFGGIAAQRAARWKSPAAVRTLSRAIADGVADWRKGPDQDLPGTSGTAHGS